LLVNVLLSYRNYTCVNRPGREANNSPPSCAEDESEWRCTTTTHVSSSAEGKLSLFFKSETDICDTVARTRMPHGR
jgi:hypothetical protein